MNLYEHCIRRGRWLIARRRLAMPLLAILCTVALLLSTPFRIVYANAWLTGVSIALTAAGILLRALAGAVADHRRRHDAEGPSTLPELIEARGLYSVVRFPAYTADLLIVCGITLYTGILWLPLAALPLGLLLTCCCVMAHEHSLQSRWGDAFTEWCRTTYALGPNPLSWQPWSIRVRPLALLLAQAPAATAILACYSIVNLLKNWRVEFDFTVDLPWLIALGVTLALSLFRPRR